MNRRGFLSGLAALPMVGGSVKLIGRPTGAAVPATDAMLVDYSEWLGIERYRTLRELWGAERGFNLLGAVSVYGPSADWHRANLEPGTRAAVILSAAGVPLTGGRHE